MNRLPVVFLLLAFLLPAALLGHAASARPAAPSASRILALAANVQDARATVGTVNVPTGAISSFGSGLPDCCTNSVLDAALDAAGSRYFALLARSGESAQRLLTFNTQTGAVTASTPLTNTVFVNYMAYDPASAQLLALVFSTDPYFYQVGAHQSDHGRAHLVGRTDPRLLQSHRLRCRL